MQRQFHCFKHCINTLLPVPVSQVSIGSYFGKSFWQDVLLEATYKFCRCKRHLFVGTFIRFTCINTSVIFIIKRHSIFGFIDTAYPVITDGATLCVYLARYSITL